MDSVFVIPSTSTNWNTPLGLDSALTYPKKERKYEFDGDATRRIGDELALVEHDQAELIEKPRRREGEVEEHFVREEAEIVPSA